MDVCGVGFSNPGVATPDALDVQRLALISEEFGDGENN